MGTNVEIILFLDTIYKMLLGRNDDTLYLKMKYVLANKFLEDQLTKNKKILWFKADNQNLYQKKQFEGKRQTAILQRTLKIINRNKRTTYIC